MSGGAPRCSQEWLDAYRRRREAQTAAERKPADTRPPSGDGLVPYSPAACEAVPFRLAEGRQTETERLYNRERLSGRGRFEPVTLRLPGGGRYTPDFMTVDDGVVTFHEVKGGYRLGSQGRAFTAFHDAAACYPMWRFVWAKRTGGGWETVTLPAARGLTGTPRV